MTRSYITNTFFFLAGGIIVLILVLSSATADASMTEVQMSSIQPARLGNETGGSSQIHYQGRLLNPVTGQPKPDGAYTMVFNLYAAASGGSALWTESKNVLVDKGLFSTLLGDTTSFPANLFTGQPLYLGIAVGGDPEAIPRQRIASVAYAIFASTAGDAATLGGKSATEFAPTSHNHTGADIANNAIDSDKIVDGSVASADIANNAINSNKIANGSVSAADIADYARTVAYPAYVLSHSTTNIQPTFAGLRWANAGDGAFLIIPRPADWDGTSDVTFRLFFYPTTNTNGNVQFFMRPRVYNVGDTFLDTTGILSSVASVGLANQYNEMQITVPASRFGTKAWWYLVFQRNTSVTGAYPDDVTIMTVAMNYTAVQ